MQGWTAIISIGVTRKRSTNRLKQTEKLFRKNLEFQEVVIAEAK